MKSLLIFSLLLLANAQWVSAQSDDGSQKLSTISLAVIIPESVDGLDDGQLSKLESKITSVVSESGMAAKAFSQNFVIYPKFEVYDVQETKGGMRNITVADCNLSLFIKQVSSGTIFSSYNKSVKGTGFNRNEAIVNAISQIKPDDAAMSTFITKAKDKIIAYYTQNCDLIMQKAERERMQKHYESGMAMLLSVPDEADACYKKAQPKALAMYKEMQQFNCKAYLQDAKTLAAQNDYEGALQKLSWIDPTVSCGGEAKTLLNSISKEVDSDKKKQWDLVFKVYDGEIAAEKAQYQFMNNLATDYLMHQAAPSYQIIVK